MSVQISADDVRRFFTLLEARAWDDLRALVADDLVYEVPQTRERIRGAAAWLQFCVDFPGEWHLAVDRVVIDPVAREAAVVVAASLDGAPLPNLAFLRFDDAGLVTRLEDWWPEPYEPPSRGAAAVERY
ncbi:nuclear transport factor 2 family protein [Kineosporia sp. R_H_3]|uniref:nuclear transport factor 2 family protein n=1 Tax=Kineosporia sp. R_H_3 TaxID=1961848 RepID=UPI000B4A63DC|nr:nuclear transport factor 2 family protein [Kineosporia sp. R_H_3]